MLFLLTACVCPFVLALMVANLVQGRKAGRNTRLEGWHLSAQLAILIVQSAPLLWWSHGIDTWIVVGIYFWPPAAVVSFSLLVFYWSQASDRTEPKR